jgi:hypothetical protein
MLKRSAACSIVRRESPPFAAVSLAASSRAAWVFAMTLLTAAHFAASAARASVFHSDACPGSVAS